MPKRGHSPNHREIYDLIRENMRAIAGNTADIRELKTDVKWLTRAVGGLDRRTWEILGTIIGMGLLGILAALLG